MPMPVQRCSTPRTCCSMDQPDPKIPHDNYSPTQSSAAWPTVRYEGDNNLRCTAHGPSAICKVRPCFRMPAKIEVRAHGEYIRFARASAAAASLAPELTLHPEINPGYAKRTHKSTRRC